MIPPLLDSITRSPPADDEAARRIALEDDVVAPLAHLAVLRLTGSDVDSFLQGQLSNDVRELRPERMQLSSWNSAKGRVLALFTGWRGDGDVWLETAADIVDAVARRLKLFVLRSKVSIESPGLQHLAMGLAGEGIAEVLASLGLPSPTAVGEVAALGKVTVMRRSGTRPRYTLHAPEAELEPLWQVLASRCRPVGSGSWQLLDILAGLPQVTAATQDHFVAQMLNLDTLGGISFSKGCYTGQEVVARLHYLGQLKRRMFLLYADDIAQAVAGGPIRRHGGDDQAVGEVVAVQRHPLHGHALLAVMQLAHAQSADLRVGDGKGAPVSQVIALVPG